MATTPRKKTTAASGASKKTTTAKKTTASKPRTTTPRAPKKTGEYIRNLHGITVHARLYSQNPKDPYRIALNPRGQNGDTTFVPLSLTADGTFVRGVGTLFEIITESEYKELEYGPVGYLGRSDAPQVIRPEDTTVATAEDWDGKGRVPQDRRTSTGRQASDREFGTGMHTADVPGADHGLHAQLAEASRQAGATAAEIAAAQRGGSSALPSDVDLGSRRVSVERVRGA